MQLNSANVSKPEHRRAGRRTLATPAEVDRLVKLAVDACVSCSETTTIFLDYRKTPSAALERASLRSSALGVPKNAKRLVIRLLPAARHPSLAMVAKPGRIVYSCKRSGAVTSRTATISEAESVVMDVIWRRGAVTAEDVFEDLKERVKWQETTVKTLLNRLLKKQVITAEKRGRRYLYQASLSREARLGFESQGLIDRLFQGRLSLLVLHLAAQRKLTKSDIAELKQVLDDLSEDD